MNETLDLQSELYAATDNDPTPIRDFVAWIADQNHISPSADVLDIGCGPGRMLTEYAARGWCVTGLEPDADFCQLAQALAETDERIRVACGGFLDLDAHERFDLITVINDPLAYLLRMEDRLEALRRVYAALRPGGVLVLEIKNFLFKLLYHEPYTEQTFTRNGERIVHLMQHDIDLHHALWTHRDEYLIEGQSLLYTKTHRVAIISPQELLYTVHQAGFEAVQTFNSYTARKTEQWNGRLLLLTARKSA